MPDALDSLRSRVDSKKIAAEAEHLESMCVELAAMAEKAEFGGIARILGVAVAEAYIVRQRHRAKATEDGRAPAES